MELDATFLISLISFILFVFIMNKIFYGPVLKIMKERQLFVEQNYNQAKLNKDETKKQIQYREIELEKSRDEARGLIAENSKKLKEEQLKKIAKYKDDKFKAVSKERDNMKKSALEAKETLKDNVVDMAKIISLKILGDSVNINNIDKSQIKEQ